MVKTLKEAYRYCTERLGESDGRIVFEYACKKSVSYMLTHPLEPADTAVLESAAARAENGEPVQYITGETEFMSLPFYVSPAVLIPRQDTETLVEFALSFLKDKKQAKGADICTGSGCIAVSVEKYAGAAVTAVDISASALEIAKKNAERNGTKTAFIRADARTFCSLSDLDFVLSNPPYIESAVVEGLDKRVKNYEPRLALDGGADGLAFYESIAENAEKMLRIGGVLAVEIGWNQGKSVSDIIKNQFGNSCVLQDLCGKDRVVYSVKNKDSGE